MIEVKINEMGGYIDVVSFDPSDTLEDIASRMNCTVYDLTELIFKLYDEGWCGQAIDWSDT